MKAQFHEEVIKLSKKPLTARETSLKYGLPTHKCPECGRPDEAINLSYDHLNDFYCSYCGHEYKKEDIKEEQLKLLKKNEIKREAAMYLFACILGIFLLAYGRKNYYHPNTNDILHLISQILIFLWCIISLLMFLIQIIKLREEE